MIDTFKSFPSTTTPVTPKFPRTPLPSHSRLPLHCLLLQDGWVCCGPEMAAVWRKGRVCTCLICGQAFCRVDTRKFDEEILDPVFLEAELDLFKVSYSGLRLTIPSSMWSDWTEVLDIL